MGGVRLAGRAVIVICSPPFTGFDGPATSGDPQVYVACTTDAPGTATKYTDFSGFTDSDANFNPVLSPDGTQVLFETLHPINNVREIWVTDAVAGSTPTQVVSSATEYSFHPFWGADSDTFVYVRGSGGALSSGSLYKDTVSSPGSPTLLKANSGAQGVFRPQFNFDGTRIGYLWTATGDPQLRCMDDDGTNDGLVDNTLTVYDSNEPPQFSWANTQNLIAFHNGATPQLAYVIDDTGGGKTDITANGVVVGASAVLSGRAWPADDSFVVITANLGSGYYTIIRAEIDGSNTTALGSTGTAINPSSFRGALVYQNRIWFISATDVSVGRGEVSYMSLTGANETLVFDSSAGSGDQLYPFTQGDGWYFD